MAKDTKANGGLVAPPEGFEKLATGHEGWIKIAKGVPITGRLVGYQRKHDGDGYEFLVSVAAPTTTHKGDEVPMGTVLALNESHKLQILRDYVATRTVFWAQPLEKIKVGRGMMWDFDVRVQKGAKTGPLPAVVQNAPPAPVSADDIPF